MYKFKLAKGTGYFNKLWNNTEKVSQDLYTVVKYNHKSTVEEVLAKAKRQFAEQIAIKEMHNVKMWVQVELDTDTLIPIGDVK